MPLHLCYTIMIYLDKNRFTDKFNFTNGFCSVTISEDVTTCSGAGAMVREAARVGPGPGGLQEEGAGPCQRKDRHRGSSWYVMH